MKSVWPRMIRLMPFGNSRERTPDRNAYEKSAVSCSREAASLSPAGTKKLVFCLFDLLEPVRID